MIWASTLLIVWTGSLVASGITNGSVWIGGTNYGKGDASKDYYWYPSGKAFTFVNWDTAQPDNRKWPPLTPHEAPDIEHCVYVTHVVDGTYKWADGLCSEPMYVLCDDGCDRISGCMYDYVCGENPRGTISEKDIEDQVPECRTAKWTFDKILDTGSCSCLGSVNKTIHPKDKPYIRFPPLKLNWWEARNWCLQNNLILAVIYNENDQNSIVKTINHSRDQVWISGTDWGQHGYWYWASTGHPLTKYDGVGEPARRFWKTRNGTEVKEHCLYIDVEDNHNWLDGDCFTEKYFVCESICGDIHKCYCEDHSTTRGF